ncbi:UNVERIFIED_CONTAM: hypothetical protein PYX00_002661 [Menopon gallinae]|uniref:Uncharacterized protein n=1 Tax=Menopon gallinae TaxID=328185 RepID=A0AAW2HY12_9NEOP
MKMKFSLILFINLAAIATTQKLIQTTVKPSHKIRLEIPDKCSNIFERFNKFKSCEIPEEENITYPVFAVPYICLLSAAMLIESCDNQQLTTQILQFNETSYDKTVCPLTHNPKKNFGNITLAGGISYLSSADTCKIVCEFGPQIKSDCKVMKFLSEILSRSHDYQNTHEQEVQTETDLKPANSLVKQLKTVGNVGPDKSSIKKDHILEQKANVTSEKTTENSDVKSSIPAHVQGNNNRNNPIDDHIKEQTSAKKDMNYDRASNITESGAASNVRKPNPLEIETTSSERLNDRDPYSPNYNKKDQYGDLSDESMIAPPEKNELPNKENDYEKSIDTKEFTNTDNFFRAEDSHFSVYFLMTVSIIIIGYIIYHNKNKIVAYALEGRRNKSGRRRPTSASYRKLDCNLEEAIASNPSHASVTNVVY